MTNPQTIAEEIYKLKHLGVIQKYGCCAFVTLWCLGLDPSDSDAIKILDDAIEEGVLEKDCTVKWLDFVRWLTGRQNVDVEFHSISSIKSINRRTPVRYDYNGNSHWVGVEHGEIAFNPLKKSVCVAMGKPTTSRIILINGVQI